MTRRHTYRHMDKEPLEIRINILDLVKLVSEENYGVHRFLSNLVDVRREGHAQRIANYRRQGNHDTADRLDREKDKLAEGINQLLEEGLF